MHYEVRNPGWFGAWLKRQSASDAAEGTAKRAAGGSRAGRPRPPLTPWTAFVQATLDTLQKSHPEAAAGVKHVELMVGSHPRNVSGNMLIFYVHNDIINMYNDATQIHIPYFVLL